MKISTVLPFVSPLTAVVVTLCLYSCLLDLCQVAVALAAVPVKSGPGVHNGTSGIFFVDQDLAKVDEDLPQSDQAEGSATYEGTGTEPADHCHEHPDDEDCRFPGSGERGVSFEPDDPEWPNPNSRPNKPIPQEPTRERKPHNPHDPFDNTDQYGVDDDEDEPEDDEEDEDDDDDDDFDEDGSGDTDIYSERPQVTEHVTEPVEPTKKLTTKKPLTGAAKTTETPDMDFDDDREANNLPDDNGIGHRSSEMPDTRFAPPKVTSLPPNVAKTDDDNSLSNEVSILGQKQDNRPASFFAQPGILAAVIGGAVVGLLCAILLVMFIVYRMRKKDEGSYALDEPKRSPAANPYSRGASKEFFA